MNSWRIPTWETQSCKLSWKIKLDDFAILNNSTAFAPMRPEKLNYNKESVIYALLLLLLRSEFFQWSRRQRNSSKNTEQPVLPTHIFSDFSFNLQSKYRLKITQFFIYYFISFSVSCGYFTATLLSQTFPEKPELWWDRSGHRAWDYTWFWWQR